MNELLWTVDTPCSVAWQRRRVAVAVAGMSLIGSGCVLVVAGGTQTRVGVFRAASQPIQRSSDFNKIQASSDRLTEFPVCSCCGCGKKL